MIRRPRKTSPEIVMGELALQMPEMVVDEGLHDSTVVTLVYPKLEIGEEPNRFPRHPSITCLVREIMTPDQEGQVDVGSFAHKDKRSFPCIGRVLPFGQRSVLKECVSDEGSFSSTLWVLSMFSISFSFSCKFWLRVVFISLGIIDATSFPSLSMVA
ncbi:hypothetical protein V6N12_057863 [Hibiscus sabdariffa]|uniref:Uncharacterized protein n=1 Tax=Hibiscus sabdariffa TaxID=183260 RepID=A0ABR2B5M8_9ROSI